MIKASGRNDVGWAPRAHAFLRTFAHPNKKRGHRAAFFIHF